MFIKKVPDNRGHRDGFYCSLVDSVWRDGVCRHVTKTSFGFVPTSHIPYLVAAFDDSGLDPEDVVKREKQKLEDAAASSRNGG